MSLNGLNFKLAQSQFFDRAVAKSLDAASRRVLSKFGAFVRRSAKSSLKRARQKKLAEMTPDERRRYDVATMIAKARGQKKPRRPDIISKPGDPPKLHMKPKSPLRELIFFVYVQGEKAVLIGPTASKQTHGKATQALEYGGASIAKARGRTQTINVAARPFMAPAAQKELPKLREWKNSLK